jgi:hypothetical protein
MPRPAVASLHRGDDFFQRGRIMPVAREDLVAQRQTAACDHQANAHLFAIPAMVARVAALGEWVPIGLSFEVRAGHIVEQQIVLDGEEFAESLFQKDLQLRLVRQQIIQPTVQSVIIDAIDRHAQGRRIKILTQPYDLA